MKKYSSQKRAASFYTLFLSDANVKADKNLKIEMRWNESNLSDFPGFADVCPTWQKAIQSPPTDRMYTKSLMKFLMGSFAWLQSAN